jgi:hypothetical protein
LIVEARALLMLLSHSGKIFILLHLVELARAVIRDASVALHIGHMFVMADS